MDSTISDEAQAKARARAKRIGKWAELITGIWVTLTALAAAWIAFSPSLPWEGGPGRVGAVSVIHFDRISRLLALEDPAALRMAQAAARGVLALEDAGGGFRRGAGKRLFDQAQAVRALKILEPRAARRTLDYVAARLSDPAGGYFAGESATGIDRRKSRNLDAMMANAVQEAGDLASAAQKAHARKALARLK